MINSKTNTFDSVYNPRFRFLNLYDVYRKIIYGPTPSPPSAAQCRLINDRSSHAEADTEDDVENIIFLFILSNTAVMVKSPISMAHIICHANTGRPATCLELDICKTLKRNFFVIFGCNFTN